MGMKDTFNNLLNRGPFKKKDIPEKDLVKVEEEVYEITRKLDVERKSREGIGKFFKHPIEVPN